MGLYAISEKVEGFVATVNPSIALALDDFFCRKYKLVTYFNEFIVTLIA